MRGPTDAIVGTDAGQVARRTKNLGLPAIAMSIIPATTLAGVMSGPCVCRGSPIGATTTSPS